MKHLSRKTYCTWVPRTEQTDCGTHETWSVMCLQCSKCTVTNGYDLVPQCTEFSFNLKDILGYTRTYRMCYTPEILYPRLLDQLLKTPPSLQEELDLGSNESQISYNFKLLGEKKCFNLGSNQTGDLV